jgi:hypothetical protein
MLAGAVAAMAATGAQAAHINVGNYFDNYQTNWGSAHIYSHLNLYGKWLGSLRATSVAIGNNASFDGDGNLVMHNRQLQLWDVGATLNAYVKGVHGDASLTAIGMCNNASVTNGNANSTYIRNLQSCGTLDPFAISNVNLSNVGGDATVSAVAIGNNFSVDATPGVNLSSTQTNVALTYSRVNADLSDIAGDVTITSAAIGNNMSVIADLP